MSTTLVTALFDIGRDHWPSYSRSSGQYLDWIRNTLAIDCNMVIYTENKFKDAIISFRKSHDREWQKTKIIITPIEELPAYKSYANALQDLMSSEEFKKKVLFDVPEMMHYLYNVIVFGKLHFLKDTHDSNYFPGQDLLVWADAGGLREDIRNYADVKWPDPVRIDKTKITFFSHHFDLHISTESNHALSQVRYIQGTCFTVPIHLVEQFSRDFKKIVFDCLDNKYIGSDEKILDFYYLQHSDLCILIKCTWREYFDILKRDAPVPFRMSSNSSHHLLAPSTQGGALDTSPIEPAARSRRAISGTKSPPITQHRPKIKARNSRRRPSIFVSIANYRDSETPHTLRHLFAKARYPERVVVGVFSQVVPGEDDDCLPGDWPPERLRALQCHASKSLGACWARSRILEELWQGEDYVLQIDSHSRFVEGWDEGFLEQLRACPSDFPVLTTYPPGYVPPDQLTEDCYPVLSAQAFNAQGILLIETRAFHASDRPAAPMPSAFLSANCLFAPAAAWRQVPYDPYLYFHGEESSLAVRFWTHGWDLFAPNCVLMYHDYTPRPARPRHWHDRENWEAYNLRSFLRYRHLLAGEISDDPFVTESIQHFGLGIVRTLSEFEAYADVNFARSYIGPRATDARFPPHPSRRMLIRQRLWREAYLCGVPGTNETRNGNRSRPETTLQLRPALANWLREQKIRYLIDAGCGDFTWLQRVSMPTVGWYAGYDIVPEQIAANQDCYGHRAGLFFNVGDITEIRFPAADAILCRDVIETLSIAEALAALQRFRASGTRYLLATTMPGALNLSAKNPGEWQGRDLRSAPFCLPAPFAMFHDGDGIYLGVWRLDQMVTLPSPYRRIE